MCMAAAFTPHARGSTSKDVAYMLPLEVYPACAGIDLVFWSLHSTSICLPRMRGDRPPYPIDNQAGYEFTPHARGST